MHPVNSLARDVDELLVFDCCHRPDSSRAKSIETELMRVGYLKLPHIVGVAKEGETPDCFDLRTDAAFRIINHLIIDLYRWQPDFAVLRPEFGTLRELSELFADATPHDLHHITPRRLHALHRFLLAIGDLPLLGLLQQRIAGLVERGVADGRVSDEQLGQPEWGLRPDEEEALKDITGG